MFFFNLQFLNTYVFLRAIHELDIKFLNFNPYEEQREWVICFEEININFSSEHLLKITNGRLIPQQCQIPANFEEKCQILLKKVFIYEAKLKIANLAKIPNSTFLCILKSMHFFFIFENFCESMLKKCIKYKTNIKHL